MKIQHFSNTDESSSVMTHTNCQYLRLLYPVQSSPFSSCSWEDWWFLWTAPREVTKQCIDEENNEGRQRQSLACWRKTHQGINTHVHKWHTRAPRRSPRRFPAPPSLMTASPALSYQLAAWHPGCHAHHWRTGIWPSKSQFRSPIHNGPNPYTTQRCDLPVFRPMESLWCTESTRWKTD